MHRFLTPPQATSFPLQIIHRRKRWFLLPTNEHISNNASECGGIMFWKHITLLVKTYSNPMIIILFWRTIQDQSFVRVAHRSFFEVLMVEHITNLVITTSIFFAMNDAMWWSENRKINEKIMIWMILIRTNHADNHHSATSKMTKFFDSSSTQIKEDTNSIVK